MDKNLLKIKVDGNIIYIKDGYAEEIELFVKMINSAKEKNTEEEFKDAR